MCLLSFFIIFLIVAISSKANGSYLSDAIVINSIDTNESGTMNSVSFIFASPWLAHPIVHVINNFSVPWRLMFKELNFLVVGCPFLLQEKETSNVTPKQDRRIKCKKSVVNSFSNSSCKFESNELPMS